MEPSPYIIGNRHATLFAKRSRMPQESIGLVDDSTVRLTRHNASWGKYGARFCAPRHLLTHSHQIHPLGVIRDSLCQFQLGSVRPLKRVVPYQHWYGSYGTHFLRTNFRTNLSRDSRYNLDSSVGTLLFLLAERNDPFLCELP